MGDRGKGTHEYRGVMGKIDIKIDMDALEDVMFIINVVWRTVDALNN